MLGLKPALRWEKKTMAKYDIGELITALNEAVNKLNNLRAKYSDLEKERDALRAALQNIAADCETDYPPSYGAIKYAARAALEEKES